MTVAIAAILGALAYDGMSRTRPRANFNGVSAELQSLVHFARLHALAEGVSVAVLVYPQYRGEGSQGRIIVYQESTNPAWSLFNTAAALNFDNYDPAVLAAAAPPAPDLPATIVTTLDLSSGVNFGPDVGLAVAALPFPYNGITTNVACSFCNAGGTGTRANRGAIVFNSRGQASFYSAAGNALAVQGGSLSICGTDLIAAGTTSMSCGGVLATGTFTTSTLVVTGVSGTGRTFHNG
ncbi:MAG: hypothetical protein A2V77_15740 [Anaeromyxobacter sp. RBG_16_69_14]|nr:MAG: hypothetical protein A2V77_15740 [Anaeromyxobacter sp. RBG_16_69_14]